MKGERNFYCENNAQERFVKIMDSEKVQCPIDNDIISFLDCLGCYKCSEETKRGLLIFTLNKLNQKFIDNNICIDFVDKNNKNLHFGAYKENDGERVQIF